MRLKFVIRSQISLMGTLKQEQLVDDDLNESISEYCKPDKIESVEEEEKIYETCERKMALANFMQGFQRRHFENWKK